MLFLFQPYIGKEQEWNLLFTIQGADVWQRLKVDKSGVKETPKASSPPENHVPPTRDLDDGWAERLCPVCKLWFSVPPGEAPGPCPYCPLWRKEISFQDWLTQQQQHGQRQQQRDVPTATAEGHFQESSSMDINKNFTGDWLKAEQFTTEQTFTIKHVAMERVGGDDKPVVSFLEMTQGLVLNKTNASAIASLYGSETNHWTGKQVTLYPTSVDFAGKQVRAIRVRAPGHSAPAPTRPASSPPPPPRRQQAAPAAPPPPPEPRFWLDEGGADPQLHTLAAIREKVNGGAEGLFWMAQDGKEWHPVDQAFLSGGDPFPG